MTNSDSGYTKKFKHFLMVLNYIKEQIALGQIEARKIYGKLNTADMHTKPLRSAEFLAMAHKILYHPPPSTGHYPYPFISRGNSVFFRHNRCRGLTEHRDEAIHPCSLILRPPLMLDAHPSLYHSTGFGFANGSGCCRCSGHLIVMQMPSLLEIDATLYVPPNHQTFCDGALDTYLAGLLVFLSQ